MKGKDNAFSRRGFMKAGVMGMVGFGRLHALTAMDTALARTDPADPFLGYRTAVGGYGFRHFTTEEAVAMSRGLGLSYISMWPGSAGLTGGGKRKENVLPFDRDPERWASVKEVLDRYNVQCCEYGVSHFGPNMEENRKVFEFCRQNGIPEIAGYPSYDALDNLDRLLEEYKIPVGIHNHGPEDKLYQKISQVEWALKDHHELLGACVDIGHFARAGQDPVEAIYKFGKRVYGIHLKDLTFDDEQAIVGEGRLNILAVLNALQDLEFEGPFTIEYEATPEAFLPPVVQCMENVKNILARTRRWEKFGGRR